MKAIPVLVLLGGAVTLGILLGLQYLRRERSRPVMIGIHLLLGAGGLEVLVMLLSGAPDRTLLVAGELGKAAAALLVAALLTGLIAPMVGRGSRRTMNVALAIHASLASLGFALLLAWLVFGFGSTGMASDAAPLAHNGIDTGAVFLAQRR